jgi:iron complex transport system substrate-binding protein
MTAGFVLVALITLACEPSPTITNDDAVPAPPQRIISMAPSLTEIVYALDLDAKLVAVTRYCDYPEAALAQPQIGGFLDPNYEAIVALEPDLVLLIQDHAEVKARLESLNLASLQVDHSSIDDILQSIEVIANTCGVPDRGTRLATSLRQRLDRLDQRLAGVKKPRTLLVVDRDIGTGTVSRIWAAGQGSFLSDAMISAGAENALSPSTIAYPEISREGLISIDPDVILDLVTAIERGEVEASVAEADWTDLDELTAVRSGSVYVIPDGLLEIPGPRIIEAVERLAELLHPTTSREDQ